MREITINTNIIIIECCIMSDKLTTTFWAEGAVSQAYNKKTVYMAYKPKIKKQFQ